MTFTYNLKMHTGGKMATVTIPFDPYTNALAAWDGVTTGWVSPDSTVTLTADVNRKIVGHSTLDLNMVLAASQGTIYKDVACTASTKYLVSCYVRNNGVLTAGLRVGSETDWSSNFFTNRLLVVVDSGVSTSLRINLDLIVSADPYRQNVWVGGFFMVPLTVADESLSREELSLKYAYVSSAKSSPSMKDLLAYKFHGSPFQYFLTADGVRVANYNYPLADYGIDENTLLESHLNELPVQLYQTFIDSVALMTMLDGDVTRVSHTYPKMPNNDEDLRIFPRVQYFMGFEVSSAMADSKPLANNVNLSINIYVPITKVSNSMQDSMLSTVVTQLMGSLGFVAIRGSDYFREPEQLYVRQTQYVKDVQLVNKIKI